MNITRNILILLLTCPLAGPVILEGLFGVNLSRPAFAELGLSVTPGKVILSNVPLGRKVDTQQLGGSLLIISNQSPFTQTYSLSIHKPFEVGMKCSEDYQEIPDPEWVYFVNPDRKREREINEIEIEGGQSKEVALYLKIPEREEYYNQRYEAIIKIVSKPGKGEFLSLALYPRLQITTKTKER